MKKWVFLLGVFYSFDVFSATQDVMPMAHVWQLLFWLITSIVLFMGLIISFFWKNFVKRIESNFDELFGYFKLLAKQGDLDDLEKEVKDLHDRIIKIEAKINNCKSCNQ